MNEILKVNYETETSSQTPIEIALGIDEKGMTTATTLYEFLELNPSNYAKWYKVNIADNQFAEENVDFFPFVLRYESLTGEKERQDSRLSSEFAKKLAMASKTEKGEEARKYFIKVEDKLKSVAKESSTTELSPTLQMIQLLVNQSAEQERAIKQANDNSQKALEVAESIRSEVLEDYSENWRNDINIKVREISILSSIPYQELFTNLYLLLEQKAHCDLSALVRNKKKRMEDQGATKTHIKTECTKIALIEDNPRLKEIFTSIVKEYAVRYVA